MTSLSRQGQDLAESWWAQESRCRSKRLELAELEKHRDDAAQVLGKFLMPEDMRIGETLVAWVRLGPRDSQEAMIQVSKLAHPKPVLEHEPPTGHVFHVRVRK